LQKNEEGREKPIPFFSRALRDIEIRYEIMEKHYYALVKSLKSFRVYVLHSRVIAYVPSASVKDILIQPDIDGRRGKWIVESRNSFDQIKKALTEAPVLISPDYSKYFLIFSFASFDTVATVLLQKNV